jgi:hypothetical protein
MCIPPEKIRAIVYAATYPAGQQKTSQCNRIGAKTGAGRRPAAKAYKTDRFSFRFKLKKESPLCRGL